MRTRYLKPGFFENEHLALLPAHARLLYAGLWLMADREGRLKDRPARIKGELFPYESVNVGRFLILLAEAGFIKRYTVDGQDLIWIPTFLDHQRPHQHEAASTLAVHPDDQRHTNGEPMSRQGTDIDTAAPALKGKGNSNFNSNFNGEREPEPSALAGAGPPSRHSQSDWDFSLSLYKAHIDFDLSQRDRDDLRALFDKCPHPDWMNAAINQATAADKPGIGYVKRTIEACIKDNTPPSSLKKTQVGR